MTLNTNYMTSSDLDEYFVDKDTGLPLSGGIVTFYQDNQRNVLQNVYTLSGSPPNYTYTALPNPLTLNATGQPVDASGNIVKIYYYPFDSTLNLSLYYVTVYSAQGVLQYTRQGWPDTSGLSGTNNGIGNYIENGQFLYNIGQSNNPIAVKSLELAPSNNELLYGTAPAPNMSLQKSNGAVQDVITFYEFADTQLIESNPPYYCNYTANSVGSGGETYKYFMWNFKNVNLFQNQYISFSFQGRSISSSNVTVNFVQNFGTGGSPDAPVTSILGSYNLTTSFSKYTATIRVPSTNGKNLGTNDNSYSAIIINLPLNSVCNIDITNVQLELSQASSSYFIESYDRVAALISKYSTGDIIVSVKPQKFGFLAMNDGTIGNPTSLATYPNNITYPLYCYLWNNISDLYAPVRSIYKTGTVTQSGTTVTGVGTTFTSNMVGGTIQFLEYSSGVGQAQQNSDNYIRGTGTQFVPEMVDGQIQFTAGTYSTGTASQSGDTVTGIGTTWTQAMVGGTITIGANPAVQIIGYTSPTQLTVGNFNTISATTYSIDYGGQQATVLEYFSPTLIRVNSTSLVGLNTYSVTYAAAPVSITAYISPTQLTIATSGPVSTTPYIILYGSRGSSADADFTNGRTIQLLYTTGRVLANQGNSGTNIHLNGQYDGSDIYALQAQNFPTGLTFTDSGHTHTPPLNGGGNLGSFVAITSPATGGNISNPFTTESDGPCYDAGTTGVGFANVGSPAGANDVPISVVQATIYLNFLIKL
jgi:hypothetical protein